MIPSNKWFATSLQERAAWYGNFSSQFNLLHLSLGFTAADAASVTADNDIMQFLAEAAVTVKAFSEAMRQYRLAVTEGNIGDPGPKIPDYTTPTQPNEVPAGLFERLDNLVKRIRVAPAYTDEIGAMLGILPTVTTRIAPADMQPSIKATTLPGSIVSVKFVRGAMTAVMIETQIDNSGTWSNVGNFYSSPAELVIPQNPQNLPRSVRIRARFVDGNSPVGQFSDIVATATQPTA